MMAGNHGLNGGSGLAGISQDVWLPGVASGGLITRQVEIAVPNGGLDNGCKGLAESGSEVGLGVDGLDPDPDPDPDPDGRRRKQRAGRDGKTGVILRLGSGGSVPDGGSLRSGKGGGWSDSGIQGGGRGGGWRSCWEEGGKVRGDDGGGAGKGGSGLIPASVGGGIRVEGCRILVDGGDGNPVGGGGLHIEKRGVDDELGLGFGVGLRVSWVLGLVVGTDEKGKGLFVWAAGPGDAKGPRMAKNGTMKRVSNCLWSSFEKSVIIQVQGAGAPALGE